MPLTEPPISTSPAYIFEISENISSTGLRKACHKSVFICLRQCCPTPFCHSFVTSRAFLRSFLFRSQFLGVKGKDLRTGVLPCGRVFKMLRFSLGRTITSLLVKDHQVAGDSYPSSQECRAFLLSVVTVLRALPAENNVGVCASRTGVSSVSLV